MGVFTSFNLSSFNRTSSWNAKPGSEPLPPTDFALDNATNKAPGFFALHSHFTGRMTTYTRKPHQRPQSCLDTCGLWYLKLVLVEFEVAYNGKTIRWPTNRYNWHSKRCVGNTYSPYSSILVKSSAPCDTRRLCHWNCFSQLICWCFVEYVLNDITTLLLNFLQRRTRWCRQFIARPSPCWDS